MTKGSHIAFPCSERHSETLTKREHFASIALQGLLTKYSLNKPEDQQLVCQMAVELADSLIVELNATYKPK